MSEKLRMWRCPDCGRRFRAREPLASIPVSVVRCPTCGGIGDAILTRREATVADLKHVDDLMEHGQILNARYKLKEIIGRMACEKACEETWSVKLGKDTYERLDEMKCPGQSYDGIVQKLIYHKKHWKRC